MPASKPPPDVPAEFRRRIEREDPGEDLRVRLRVRGGLPSQRLDYELELEGGGTTRLRMSDAVRRRTARPFEERLDRQRLRRLLRRTADLLDVAVPLRRISFVPDSLVGEIEIEVGGRRRTLYFHPEPDDLPGPEDIDAETVEDLTDRLVRSARPPEPDEGILDE